MSETLTIEGLLTDYARCLKAYFEEGCHDEVYENQGKAGNAIVAHATTLVNRIAELEAMLDCRAGRLLLKGASFIVVKDDEPYYGEVYATIRDHEIAKSRWTEEDERIWKETTDDNAT